MDNGMYIGVKTRDAESVTFIPEEVLNFEGLNRRVDARAAAQAVRREKAAREDKAAMERQRQTAAAEKQWKRTLVKRVEQLMLAFLGLFLLAYLELLHAGVATVAGALCLATVCYLVGVFFEHQNGKKRGASPS